MLHRLDVRGLPCPLPVIRLAEVVRTAAPGDTVELVGTDPALVADTRAFCVAAGHAFLEGGAHPEGWCVQVRVGNPPR